MARQDTYKLSRLLTLLDLTNLLQALVQNGHIADLHCLKSAERESDIQYEEYVFD